MRWTFAGSLALGLAAVAAGPATAQAPVFNGYLSGGACYLRLYDGVHMRRNPRQTLSKFHVTHRRPDPLQAQNPDAFTVHFGYWVKNAGAYSGFAQCRTTSSGATCNAEADGGSFTLTPKSAKILRVTLGARLGIEGQKGFSPNVATEANRVILVPVTRVGVCQ